MTWLPKELVHKILLFSGHIKLRYNHKLTKIVAVKQMNLTTNEWLYFNQYLGQCVERKKYQFSFLRIVSGIAGLAYSN